MICITTSLVSLQVKADLVKISYRSLYGSGLAAKKKKKRQKEAIEKVVQLCWLYAARTPTRGLNLPSCGRFTLYIKKDVQCFSTEHTDTENVLLNNF